MKNNEKLTKKEMLDMINGSPELKKEIVNLCNQAIDNSGQMTHEQRKSKASKNKKIVRKK